MTTATEDKAPEPRQAPCRSNRCRMPVLWVVSATTAKWVPLSVKTKRVLNIGEEPARGEMVIGTDNLVRSATQMDYGRTIYMNHWADCKEKPRFRKKKKR